MAIHIKYYPHGTTLDNEAGIATGQADTDLSPLGEDQAKRLGEHERAEEFDEVFSSDLIRAKRTAEMVFGNRYPVKIDRRLREIDVGDLTCKKDDAVNPLKKKCIPDPFPNGESYMDVEKRTGDFLKSLKGNTSAKRIAIIGHQSTQLAFEVLLNKKTWEKALDTDWRLTKNWQPGWEYLSD